MKKYLLIISSIFLMNNYLHADSITVKMYTTDNQKYIGSIVATDNPNGLLLTADLNGLTEGKHGFHLHANPSCSDNGMAAGGHLDPNNTNSHNGPYNNSGHFGDLPALYALSNSKVNMTVLAPRLKVKDILNHSLMIHVGGDNYSNTPVLGGGGARLACGVVKK
ncbi:superoxide dismutase family protein [Rickettsiales bacterium LUAb2]